MCQHLSQLDDDIPTSDDEVPTPSTDIDDDDAQAHLQPMKIGPTPAGDNAPGPTAIYNAPSFGDCT